MNGGIQVESEVEFAIEDLTVPTTEVAVGEFLEARRDPSAQTEDPDRAMYTVYTPGKPRQLLGHPPREVEARMAEIESKYGELGFTGQVVSVHEQHQVVPDQQIRVHLTHRSQIMKAKRQGGGGR
jgi:hypothetical protein